MTRKDANAYKLHMAQKGMSTNSISNYLGTFSGFWNWAIRSGELTGENPWQGQKQGLPKAKKRQALDPEALSRASEKADQLEDIRFFLVVTREEKRTIRANGVTLMLKLVSFT